MIPIRDQMPTRHTPYITYGLIAINVAVFIVEMAQGRNFNAFVREYGMIPARLTQDPSIESLSRIFTSMFMHGGLAHIGSNMLYLWIFGDNVEDTIGHWPYLGFYLLGGILASLTHVLSAPFSTIPTVGASGAIAAVLGGYLILYPQSRVITLMIFGYFIRVVAVPAVIVLGLWFILQFFQGILTLGMPMGAGGVAVWAHIGGFIAGVVLINLFPQRKQTERIRSLDWW